MVEEKVYRIMFTGVHPVGPLSDRERGAPFKSHNLVFEPRKIYRVSKNIYEWAAHQRYFIVDISLSKEEVMDWPKGEKNK